MKVHITDDWLMHKAKGEGKLPVAAGKPSIEDAGPIEEVQHMPIPAFGMFIRLRRRDSGLSMEELAKIARIDIEELCSIETIPTYVPEPRTVVQLSKVLRVDTDRLLELSGNSALQDDKIEQEAVRFAARCHSAEKLSRKEKKALDEFIHVLNKEAKKSI